MLGDNRKFVSALVVPDYDVARRELGSDASDRELAADGRCRRLVEDAVEGACQRFAAYERPKKVALSERELTPTLKVKLRVVKKRYREEIEGLYG